MAIKNASFINRKSEVGGSDDAMKGKAFAAIESQKAKYKDSVDRGRKLVYGGGSTEEEYIRKNLAPEYKAFYDLYLSEQQPKRESQRINQKTIPGYTPEQVSQLRGTVAQTPTTNTKVETVTPGTDDLGNTNIPTSGKQEDGSYSFKDYDELMSFITDMQNQAGEGHGIYKNQMSSASGYADDFAKWLQDVRDVVMKEAQANPLETDWGKGILDYYGVLGDNSANAVNAATAGENAGNIDSFAAANAERQRVSKLGQGIQSVMGMSAERFNNMISGLESIGVNTERLFGAQGDLADTARQYATDLYDIDAQSTAAYNELMAALEGSGNTTINLDDNAVISKLKDVYSNLNLGDGEDIDWTTTDKESWAEVIKTLKTNPNFSGLTDDYLYDLIAKIMSAQTAEKTEVEQSEEEAVKVDPAAFERLPSWIKSLLAIA